MEAGFLKKRLNCTARKPPCKGSSSSRRTREDRLQKKLFYAAITGFCYLVLYGISRHYFDIGQPFYMYTPSWTARNVIWFAAFISVIPSLFGHYRFSMITLAGYVLGVIAGELFGGFRSDIPPEYRHYGWLIWGFVYLSAAITGILVEILRGHHRKKRTRNLY